MLYTKDGSDLLTPGNDNYNIQHTLDFEFNDDDNLSEDGDYKNEPEDSSLKELYSEQSFTSFDVLE